MIDLTFVTSYPGKAREVSQLLQVELRHRVLEVAEIQSLDAEQIVEHKLHQAFLEVDGPVLVEDTSLTFAALGGLPGPLIKWFSSELGNAGLCRLLDGYDTRAARASIVYGLFDGRRTWFFDGSTDGEIATEPRGDGGFGWDSIFIPRGRQQTWGEMSTREKAVGSMRSVALNKLHDFLSKA
jgi:non-canonical purine NTP pyrophosphatase (RdgB/HAM1 family)